MRRFKYILIAILLFVSNDGIGQVDCNTSLSEAYNLYKTGSFDSAISRLKGCFSSFKSSDERFEAHRIFALAYSAKGEMDSADIHARLILKERPDHIKYTQGHDPKQLSRLLEKYRVLPAMYFSLFLGPNLNTIMVDSRRNPYVGSNSSYNNRIGYTIGLGLNFHLKDRLFFQASVSELAGSMEHEIRGLNGMNLFYTEQYKLASLTSGLSYQWLNKPNWKANVEGNLGYAHLHFDHRLVTHEITTDPDRINFSDNGLSIRDRNQLFGSVGISIERKLLKGSLGFRWQYDYYFKTLANASSHGDHTNFDLNSLYFSDLVKLRIHQFQLVYKIPISYKVYKIK
jgi:hypothetical protein